MSDFASTDPTAPGPVSSGLSDVEPAPSWAPPSSEPAPAPDPGWSIPTGAPAGLEAPPKTVAAPPAAAPAPADKPAPAPGLKPGTLVSYTHFDAYTGPGGQDVTRVGLVTGVGEQLVVEYDDKGAETGRAMQPTAQVTWLEPSDAILTSELTEL